ncbi:MAG TPA: hypothetical protein VI160_09015 [Gemmatimonadales bacterium]
MSPDQTVFLTLAIIAIGGVLLLPLVRAYADRIRAQKHPAPPELPNEVLTELTELRREMGELAERMDFAERLLARQKDGERLGPGSAR